MSALLFFFAPFVAMQLGDVEVEDEAPIQAPPEDDYEEPPFVEPPEVAVEPPPAEAPRMDVPPVEIPPVAFEEPPHVQTQEERDFAGALHQREVVRDVHRGFGIAAWISLTATLALGSIQIYDDYGPFAARESDTPCRTGNAIFPDFCGDEIPWPHMTSAIVTGTLYYTAAAMAYFWMPDPLHIDSQQTSAGERLRIHKALRWVHTVTMLMTTALGTITANLPREEVGFDVRQGLAIAHMGLGALTWIFLTAAALVMF